MDENAKVKIKHEISRIERLLFDVKPLLDLCKLKEPDIIEIAASAQVLHSFYNGVESLIVLIFKNINIELPKSIKWHKTLFEMAFGENIKNVSIINNEIKTKLEKYMLIRHLIRHTYSSELNWDEMGPLIFIIEDMWRSIKSDIEVFIENY